MQDIAQRLSEVEKRIESAAQKSGRKRSDILLVAVTKTHPPEMINAAIAAGVGVGQTMCFFVMAVTSVLHVFTVRSRGSVFCRNVRDNMPLVWSAAAMVVVFSALVLVEPLGAVFGMFALGWVRWAVACALAVVPTLVAELFKLWENRHETRLFSRRLVRHQAGGQE